MQTPWSLKALLLAGLLLVLPQVASAKIIEESELDFAVTAPALQGGDIQLSISYTAQESLKRAPLNEIDIRKIAHAPDTGVVVVKAAFITSRKIEEVNEPKFFDMDRLGKLFPSMTFEQGGSTGCLAKASLPDIPLVALPKELVCEFSIKHLSGTTQQSRRKISAASSGLRPRGMAAPDAMTEQSCESVNFLFRRTSSQNRYYRLANGRTLVVMYEVLGIRTAKGDIANKVPDFLLRRQMSAQIREEIQYFVNALNRR